MPPVILPLQAPLHLRAWRAAGQALRTLSADIIRRYRAREVRDELARLDDRALRDLGIDRSELGSIAAHPGPGDRIRFWRSILQDI